MNEFTRYISKYGIFINECVIYIDSIDISNDKFIKFIDKYDILINDYIIWIDDYGILNDKTSGFMNNKGADKILNLNFWVTDVNDEKSDGDFCLRKGLDRVRNVAERHCLSAIRSKNYNRNLINIGFFQYCLYFFFFRLRSRIFRRGD